MQCHNCPKDGKPDAACLTCRCAEYLDNDFKTVIPSGDRTDLASAPRPPPDNPFPNVPKHVVRDCSNVLEELKHCHPDSFPHLFKLFTLFVSANAAMLAGVLQGQTLTEYAKGAGITKQASHQAWSRQVARNPVLRNVPVKRRKSR